MVKYTNEHDIDISVLVWLMQNGYNSGADKAPDGFLISATTLLQSTRKLILTRQADKDAKTIDVAELAASRMGHALHDSIERAWTHGDLVKALESLGYPHSFIECIKVNPDPSTLTEDDIPVFLEKRGFKKFAGVVITGQLDFSLNGGYRDFKSTSTFSYTSGNKDEDYIIQGSIYRWLMPEYIWADRMRIQFIFTDWLKYRANADPEYPQHRMIYKEYDLMSLEETEKWIRSKIKEIRNNAKLPQDKMIRCSDKDLWKSPDTYKYYVNPQTAEKGGRCSRRFDDLGDAETYKDEKGKGVIVTQPGEVKACRYCDAFEVCEQRKEYFPDE